MDSIRRWMCVIVPSSLATNGVLLYLSNEKKSRANKCRSFSPYTRVCVLRVRDCELSVSCALLFKRLLFLNCHTFTQATTRANRDNKIWSISLSLSLSLFFFASLTIFQSSSSFFYPEKEEGGGGNSAIDITAC